MKLKYFIILLLIIPFTQSAYSQYDKEDDMDATDFDEQTFKDRLYTGGNLGLSFGTYTTIDISPIVGYKITEDFSAGVGAKYNYFKFNGTPSFTSSIYGGSVFSRYMLFEQLVLHTELEMLSVKIFNYPSPDTRKLVPIGLVGGGYQSGILQLLVLYDVIGDKNNPYIGSFGPQSRIYIRGGIVLGF